VTEADCASAKSRAALIECFQPNRRVEVTVEGMVGKQ
jgi:OOP family OmpA-OmpF porin